MSKTNVSPHWQMKAALASSLAIGLLLAGAPHVAAEEVVTSDSEASLDQASPKAEISQAATSPSDSSSLSEERVQKATKQSLNPLRLKKCLTHRKSKAERSSQGK